MAVSNEEVARRGQVACGIIQSLLKELPDMDVAERHEHLENLPRRLEKVLVQEGGRHVQA